MSPTARKRLKVTASDRRESDGGYLTLCTMDYDITSAMFDNADVRSHKAITPDQRVSYSPSDTLYVRMVDSYVTAMKSVDFEPVPDRYPDDSGRGYVGFTVISKRLFRKNDEIGGLVGFTADIPDDAIETINCYSVFKESESGPSVLMVGGLSFVNSNCEPNAKYTQNSSERSGSIRKIKAIRDIKPGDEVTVYYGRGYFGPNNEFLPLPALRPTRRVWHISDFQTKNSGTTA